MRVIVPNISGFLALALPIAMSVGREAGVNPLVCALVVMMTGDAVVYYPAQSSSALVIYERGHVSAAEMLKFGLWMTVVGWVAILAVALPWWALVGEPCGPAESPLRVKAGREAPTCPSDRDRRPRAADRPSAIAQTISDCPRCMSPQANTPGTLVIQFGSRQTLPRSVSRTPRVGQHPRALGPEKAHREQRPDRRRA